MKLGMNVTAGGNHQGHQDRVEDRRRPPVRDPRQAVAGHRAEQQVPAVCSTAMIAEFSSAWRMFTLGSVNSSVRFSHWSSWGTTSSPGAVMSVSGTARCARSGRTAAGTARPAIDQGDVAQHRSRPHRLACSGGACAAPRLAGRRASFGQCRRWRAHSPPSRSRRSGPARSVTIMISSARMTAPAVPWPKSWLPCAV